MASDEPKAKKQKVSAEKKTESPTKKTHAELR